MEKLTKQIKQKAYTECDELNFDKIKIGETYSYKQICSLTGATYLGSYSNGIKKQKELWKQYIDFEEIGGKLKITGIVDKDENGIPNRKEYLVREELGRSKYYGIIYDALMLTMLESLNETYSRNKGKVVNIGGTNSQWVLLEKSYSRWQTCVGLLSEQFRKYYDKLVGSYTGLIASKKIIHLTNEIFNRFLQKLIRENSSIQLNRGFEIMAIDRDQVITVDKKEDNLKGVEYEGKRYKFIIESADPQLMATINLCKNDAIKDLGYNSEEEAYGKGKKRIVMKMVLDRLSNINYKAEELSKTEYNVDENGEIKFLPKYKIINYWETLIIGVPLKFLIDFIKSINERINAIGKDDSYDNVGEGKSNPFKAEKYLNKIRDTINNTVIDRLLKQIEKNGIKDGDKKNDGIPFYDSYNMTTIESISGKVAKEVFEIKENNKEFFDSVEWRQGGIVPIINKNDEIVGALEEQDDGNIKIHNLDGSSDNSFISKFEEKDPDDGVEYDGAVITTLSSDNNSTDENGDLEFSPEEILGLLDERKKKTNNLAKDIEENYMDLAKGLVTIFGQRGDNNYDMATNIKITKQNDAKNIFKEIKLCKQNGGNKK